MSEPIDLVALDRDVRRAATQLERSRAKLATDEGRAAARHEDPFAAVRHVAGQATYARLADLSPSAHERDLRDGLLRAVYELLQARIGFDLELDAMDAAHEVPAEVLRRARANDAEVPSGSTFASAWPAFVLETHLPRSADGLARAADLASGVASARKEQRSRRFEVARRLGLDHPLAPSVEGPAATFFDAARVLLQATEPLAEHVLKEARAAVDPPWRPSHMLALAHARDAIDGWPAQLTVRWLDDVFGALAPRGCPMRRLPATVGAASFLRAATRYGEALRLGGTARTLPYALARDPYPTQAFRFGFLFAVAMTESAFGRKVLGLSARVASAQSRALARTMFLQTRAMIARVLMNETETSSASLFEELGARVFGTPLPDALRDAWPDPRPWELARFRALLSVLAFRKDMVERFDEDWFKNPRAGAHLTSLACGPVFPAEPFELGEAASKLAAAFEERLG